MSRYWARGKFGEHERGVRVARGAAECNSSATSLAPPVWWLYWEKTTLQRMSSRHSPHSSRRWQQQQQHSPLFPIGEQIQTFPLKFPYKTHGKRFIVYCSVIDALRRLRIAKLTTTRGITNSSLTSSACSIGIWSTLALLNLIRRIF